MDATAVSSSKQLVRIRGLDAVLGVPLVNLHARQQRSNSGNNAHWVLVGDGDAKNSRVSSDTTNLDGVRLTVEKNFLPIAKGHPGDPHTYAVVLDDAGIYYDATRPSRLERLINADEVARLPLPPDHPDPVIDIEDPEVLRRARACINKLSDYALSPAGETAAPEQLAARVKNSVLIIDQTANDPSISLGLAEADSFQRMLATARAENPNSEILIARHSPSVTDRGQWHFTDRDLDEHTRLAENDSDPAQLIAQAEIVYVVTSQLGFIALMQAKHVVCFGTPFYAGWGVTDDRGEIPIRRRKKRSLEQIFAAAYFAYTRYIDPDLFEACSLERIVDHLQFQKAWHARNATLMLGYGITWWKRHYVRRFVASDRSEVQFFQNADRIPPDLDPKSTALFVWGYRDDEKFRQTAERLAYPIWRMEDGFLRSVGLGTDLTAPASLVVDTRGIYYDARQASDLEHILAHDRFDDDLIARAKHLTAALVRTGVSKYNVGHATTNWLPASAVGKTLILVPGQVEGDASLRFGGQSIRSNARLLAAVRRANPAAHVIYKPHPDVISGNRKKGSEPVDSNYFDTLVTDISITACLESVDEIHTMTSLAGFEALLRGKSVTTYGMPFYAGWGLTKDHCHCARRTRRLTLMQLVAGTLILYPRYVNPLTGQFTTPEIIVELLRRSQPGKRVTPLARSFWGRAVRTGKAFSAGVFKEIGHLAPFSRLFRLRPAIPLTRSSGR